MNTHLTSQPARRGFTLVELMVAMSIFSIIALGAYVILTNSLILYTKNTAINMSSYSGRYTMDHMLNNISQTYSSIDLVDSTGTPFADQNTTTPAAGIRFLIRRSPGGLLRVPASTAMSSTTLTVEAPPNAPAGSTSVPKANLFLDIPRYQWRMQVASATTSGANRYNVTFSGSQALSAGFSPLRTPTDFTVVLTGDSTQQQHIPVTVLQRIAYIVCPRLDGKGYELRYYSNALTATGAAGDPFNISSNYDVIASSLDGTPDTSADPTYKSNALTPFCLQDRYGGNIVRVNASGDASWRRFIYVDLRIRSIEGNKRKYNEFNNYVRLMEAMPVRSTIF